jgi:cell wall-associated NlpC family hydrolase
MYRRVVKTPLIAIAVTAAVGVAVVVASCRQETPTAPPPPPEAAPPPPTFDAPPGGPAPRPAPAGDDGDEASDASGEGDDPLPAPLPVVADGRSARRRLADEARRTLGRVRETSYRHATTVDEEAGAYHVDCSGFVDYLLARAAPAALAALPRSPPRHPRPRAADFVAAVSAGAPPWRRLGRVADLEPGDVVAWLRPEDSPSKNTGHVMIVDGPPRPRAAGEWAVPIIDSTGLRHGASDSRARESTGVGRGTIVLVVDAAGAPVAFRWSQASTARARATTVVLGRIAE